MTEVLASTLSVAHLDYLQRADEEFDAPPTGLSWTVAQAPRNLAHVRGVGLLDKREVFEQRAKSDDKVPRQPTQDLLSGLYGYKIPVAFLIEKDPIGGLSLSVGAWEPQTSRELTAPILEARQNLIEAALDSVFAATDVEGVDYDGSVLEAFPNLGLVTGVPTAREATRLEDAPIDRLNAAMGDTSWAALTLAQPVDERIPIQLRRSVLDEIRTVQAEEKVQGAPSPLAQHYAELLTALLKTLTLGYSVGMWRVATYLLGDRSSYFRLATLWRAVFAGEKSLPEPVRVRDATKWPPEIKSMFGAWGMPDAEAAKGPGRYRHPFTYQTLLNSQQLASYIDFPRMETSGFSVSEVPFFDTERPHVDGDRVVSLGSVVHRKRLTTESYPVDLNALTRHALVAGVTGSGKTNTIFRLLKDVVAAGVPFLVLEPAKAEYRALLSDAMFGGVLRVFTAGDERISPLRLNPFEVPPGTTVAQHLDLLRSVFAASFGMWTPLPQVLEQCLHEVYADYGWNLADNSNIRLDQDAASRESSFPTLSDLVAKAAAVVPRLGYEERVTSDISAALITRLDGLRRGGKGRMLDTRRSLPIEELLAAPTVVELDWMTDDDDKAFLMALLLVRLYEHRRAEGDSQSLRHLLIVEEAHRLLSATQRRSSEEQADPRGKAVETFSQLLSEIRAYGQGVVIADQVPIRLVADVLKNTGLKVAHRTVAAEDREALAGAMAMDERQARSLTTLPVFEAAAFGDGDDTPILVRVPFSKGGQRPSDDDIADKMSEWRAGRGLHDFLGAEKFCGETCRDATVCEIARRLASDESILQAFGRAVLSTIEEPTALDRLWPDVLAAIRARRPSGLEEEVLVRALAGHLSDRYARRRGAQALWSFAATDQLSSRLRGTILEVLGKDRGDDIREQFRSFALELAERDAPPYPSCDAICDQAKPPVCLYRQAVADLIARGEDDAAWNSALTQDLADPEAAPVRTAQLSQDAAYRVIDFPEDEYDPELRGAVALGARRTALCFAQQMLAADPVMVAPSIRRFTGRLLATAGVAEPLTSSTDRDGAKETSA